MKVKSPGPKEINLRIGRRVSTIGGRQCGRLKVHGNQLGERKAAVLWRGRKPFCGGRKGREGKRGLESAVVGSHKKKTSRTTVWGAGKLSGAGFLQIVSETQTLSVGSV